MSGCSGERSEFVFKAAFASLLYFLVRITGSVSSDIPLLFPLDVESLGLFVERRKISILFKLSATFVRLHLLPFSTEDEEFSLELDPL